MAATNYGILLLPLPTGAADSTATAINSGGSAVGTFEGPDGRRHAYVYRNGKSIALPEPAGAIASSTNGLNAAGTVVGEYYDTMSHACVWSPSGVVTTLTAPNGAKSSAAVAINSSGLIVGNYIDSSFNQHACVWVIDSPTFPLVAEQPNGTVESRARAVSDNGHFVGSFTTATGTRPCLWTSFLAVTPLATPQGFDEGEANAINGSDAVAGYAKASSMNGTPCRWLNSVPGTLPLPAAGEAYVNSINDSGIMVGDFGPAGVQAVRACIWEAAAVNFLPMPKGAENSSDAAINGSGQISLTYSFGSGPRGAIVEPAGKPRVKVKGAKKRETHSKKLVLKGTTSDFVDSVTWRSGGKKHEAKGTESWRFVAPLAPGRNVISISAVGPGGRSKKARVIVIRS